MRKKIFSFFCCLALVGTMLCFNDKFSATEFAGKEDEYTAMCKDTSSLSKSDLQVCSEFSDYLKNKNSHIASSIDQTQAELDQTLQDLGLAKKQLETTTQQVDSLQAEITVLKANIDQLSQNIETKKQLLRDRMYVLQTYVNGNELANLLLSSGSIDELLTRVQCIDELTNYDKELINGLANDRALLEEKNTEAMQRYDELFALQSQQLTLTLALNSQVDNYQSTIDEKNTLMSNYTLEIGSIDESISEADRRILAEEERKKAEEEANKQQSNHNTNTNNSETPSTPQVPETPSVDTSSIGQAIANSALSRNGGPYVYGGTGPYAFDCSGLAQWAYAQNGIYIPRTVTSQYYACELVSSPQPGDLVFFNTIGYLTHVGVYLGNGQFIHAGTEASGIYVANLYSSYWQSVYQGAGRFR